MKTLFCPNCGEKNVKPGDPGPNGGELYVVLESAGCQDFYDEANPYDCPDCETRFYIGDE
jgi:predicted RNA-binding Zn-ribbon protein involved in translation (DUF1610 family)